MTQLAPRFLDRTTPPHIGTLILMAGLAALSLNVFLPSLPSMARHFAVSYPSMQLSVPLYLVATAVIQITIGPVSDAFGRRRVMLVGAAIFTIASIGSLMAPDYMTFMVFRMVQSAIATAFVLSRAVIRDTVAQDQAASMIGYVTMGMSVVPMIGPVIGGGLDEVFGWQASFVLLALAGAASVALIWADWGETAVIRKGGFAEQLRQYPGLLRSQRYWAYVLAAAFASGAFFAFLGGAPYVGDRIFGMDAATVGFYFGAPAVGYLIGNFLSGRFAARVGIKQMVVLGGAITTVGLSVLALLTLAGLGGPQVFFGLIMSVGLGNGVMLPSATSGMLSVRPALAGSAAGLGGAMMIGGGASLSALAGVVLTPTSGTMPLILLMLGSSLASLVCVWWVYARERQVALDGA
ncbi:MAG: multidrug effflux MFS transporter [Pseudomonadota bacterium]